MDGHVDRSHRLIDDGGIGCADDLDVEGTVQTQMVGIGVVQTDALVPIERVRFGIGIDLRHFERRSLHGDAGGLVIGNRDAVGFAVGGDKRRAGVLRNEVFRFILRGAVRIFGQRAVADDGCIVERVGEGFHRVGPVALDGDNAVARNLVYETDMVRNAFVLAVDIEEDDVARLRRVCACVAIEPRFRQRIDPGGAGEAFRHALDPGIVETEGNEARAPVAAAEIFAAVPVAVARVALFASLVDDVILAAFRITELRLCDRDHVMRPVAGQGCARNACRPHGSRLHVRRRIGIAGERMRMLLLPAHENVRIAGVGMLVRLAFLLPANQSRDRRIAGVGVGMPFGLLETADQFAFFVIAFLGMGVPFGLLLFAEQNRFLGAALLGMGMPFGFLQFAEQGPLIAAFVVRMLFLAAEGAFVLRCFGLRVGGDRIVVGDGGQRKQTHHHHDNEHPCDSLCPTRAEQFHRPFPFFPASCRG